MPRRIEIDIPTTLVADYQDGRQTVADLARQLGASVHVVMRKLHSLGVDTDFQTRKRLKFAHEVEDAQHLPPGTAYATVVELYQQGYSTHRIARQLGITSRAVMLILVRRGVQLRSLFYRSVFESRPELLADFARRLRALRRDRGLSQQRLAARCGFCQAAIWRLESSRNGPHWETLFKLCEALDVEPEALGVDWEPARLEEAGDAPDEEDAEQVRPTHSLASGRSHP